MPVQYLLRVVALLLFGAAIYFFVVDKLALGAAFIAIGFSMLGVSLATQKRGPGGE